MAQLDAQTVATVAAELTSATVAVLAAQSAVPGFSEQPASQAVYEIYTSFVQRLVADGGEDTEAHRPSFA